MVLRLNFESFGCFVGMENPNENGHAANGNGHANGHAPPLRPIFYQVQGGGARVQYSPATRVPRCDCRLTFSYPNRLVLAIDDERRQLVNSNLALIQDVDELGAMVTHL